VPARLFEDLGGAFVGNPGRKDDDPFCPLDELFDRELAFVAVGLPVVSLLPPANLNVRFFVPEGLFTNRI